MIEKYTYIQHAARNLISPYLDHVLEFGVARGGSIKIIKDELDKKDKKYEIFGFDSFMGFPKDWITKDGQLLITKDHYSTDGKVPNIPNVTWFSGWFKDTIPEYLKVAKDIALLHIDCDLYESTKDVLYGLEDVIVKGTIIAMDDWFEDRDRRNNEGVQRAFYEWKLRFNRVFTFCDNPGKGDVAKIQKLVEVVK